MTKTKRWLDELPLGSLERELLLVGKSARPADGALEVSWQALGAALSATAGSGGAATNSGATQAASTKIGSSLSASKVVSGGLLATAAKSLALGVAIGSAVMGASVAVQHSLGGAERATTAAEQSLAQAPRRSLPALAPPRFAAPAGENAPAPAAVPSGAAPGGRARDIVELGLAPAPRERSAPGSPAPSSVAAPLRDAGSPVLDKTASLSQQARELAELKRLIDGGAASEALRRLDTSFGRGAVSVLSEERDALYVQALDRAQRREEARAFARRFLARYPHSPYFETTRRVLSGE